MMCAMGLGLAIALALAFAFTNGFHDAANAIATLVATRGARPGQAVVLSAVFNMLGALLVGTAVAGTVAGIVTVPPSRDGRGDRRRARRRRWPGTSSPGGAACRRAPATRSSAGSSARLSPTTASDAVNWGGLDGSKPVGVFGVLIALAVSPVLGFAFGYLAVALLRTALAPRDATGRRPGPRRRVGDVGGALVQPRRQRRAEVDGRDRRAADRDRAPRLRHGAALGQARLRRGADARDRARRLAHRADDRAPHLPPRASSTGSRARASSTAVILGSSFVGAPVSTTQVVASSVVGVGGGRRAGTTCAGRSSGRWASRGC